jgi:hypothetical protein
MMKVSIADGLDSASIVDLSWAPRPAARHFSLSLHEMGPNRDPRPGSGMTSPTEGKFLDYLSLRRLATVIFVAACLGYAFSPAGKPLHSDLTAGAEISHVAMTLVEEGSFAHPFHSLPTGPTAHTAPAYVLLYAAVGKLFGTGWMGARVLWALNLVFLALQLALLPVLSERMGLGAILGALAAVLGIVVQPYRVLPEWESLLASLLFVILCLVTLSFFKSPGDWRHALLLGLLWGAAILVNPECVLLLFVWSHLASIENSPEMLSRARRAMVVVVAGAALACLPWFIRNYEQFHAVFFIRDNFGLELYASNNDCAKPTTLENVSSGCHASTHPNANAGLATEVVLNGEVRFNQEMMRRALEWIARNPRAFAWLSARRFLRFWFPYLGGYRYAIPTGFLTILSFVGLVWMYREHRLAALLIGSTLAVYPFVHYLVQFEARYRYPIFWATLLPAAYAILKSIPRRRGSDTAAPGQHKEESELLPV